MAENPTRSESGGRRLAHPWHVLASAIVVIAAVGYVVFVKNTQIDRSGLSALVIDQTGVTALKAKPVESEFVSPAKSAFAAVKKAAASDPDGTGGYGREWSGTTASGDAATQLIEILPTSAQAKAVRAQAEAEYSDASSLKAAHTTVTARFTVPDASEAFGVSFVTAKSSTASATSGTAVVFQQGRVVAISYLQSSTGGLNRADATAIARAEHSLLERSEPTFSLARTTRPLVLSVVYGLVTIAVASLMVVLPGLRRRRQASRQARRQEQARREYRARGGKAMRRHRPPTWAQRARSSGSIR